MTTTKREEEKEKEEEEEEETTIPRSSSGSSSSEKEVRDCIIFCLSFCCGVTFFFQKRFEIFFRAKNASFFSDARGRVFPFSVLSLFETRAHALSLSLSVCIFFRRRFHCRRER